MQLQPFMFSAEWVQELAGMQTGQPRWLASSIVWGADLAGANQAAWNIVFALIQIAIGLGLLHRRTVTVALASSLVWSVIVWWFGEAFGMLFMNTADSLTGAPGAVVLYALIALMVWPNDRPGGLLGDRGARTMWAALWIVMGWLWLLAANSGDDSVSNAIAGAPTGAGWLSAVLTDAARITEGRGQVIALLCAGLSFLIGCGVGLRWHAREVLWIAIVLNMGYWVVGQAFGGIATGEATDINSAPVFILLAGAMFILFPKPVRSASRSRALALDGPARTAGEVGRPGGQTLHSRRAVLTTAGVVAGLAAAAAVADLAGVTGTGGGAPPHPGPGTVPENNNSHGNGHGNNNGGSQSHRDPNSGIQTLTSEITLPPQFRSALKIPQQLRPSRRTSDTDYYEIVQSEAMATIIPGLRTPIWGYNGTFPGPTIVQNPGRTVVVSHRNGLPVPTVVHLHGGTTPHDSDGYPTDFILPDAKYGTFPEMPAMAGMPTGTDPDAGITRQTRDYIYPEQPHAGTLWYHDHRMDFTGASVYRGLAGFHITHDADERSLGLPSGARDVPLMIADRAFASDGSFLYPALDPAMHSVPGVEKSSMKGVMGDVILVNGAPWPVMKVDTARYRFRILNASNARTYQLALQDSSRRSVGFTQIGSDHGLLAAPLPQDTIQIAGAERYDVVIDFNRYKVGDQITMVNLLGSGSTAVVMRFVVARATSDSSRVPSKLSTIDAISPTPAMTRRTMKFHRGADSWTINGRVFDPTYSEADVPAGSTELWTIVSDFHHPFHIHNATMHVISRDGRAPGPYDHGWKDTVFVSQGERVQLAIRFSTFKGRYVFHCHNLEHEDMGMMANFRIT
ncbi:multicopper oxidase family protein [Streptomyces polygonati]|uniref:Multicopper oxidase family protein n=1 Tax=Streptomyces polygonati TaxID=1617087 RepID=A0ABV8HLL2_9ACTN